MVKTQLSQEWRWSWYLEAGADNVGVLKTERPGVPRGPARAAHATRPPRALELDARGPGRVARGERVVHAWSVRYTVSLRSPDTVRETMAPGITPLAAPESIFAEKIELDDGWLTGRPKREHAAKVNKEAAALVQAQTKWMGNLTTVLGLLFPTELTLLTFLPPLILWRNRVV